MKSERGRDTGFKYTSPSVFQLLKSARMLRWMDVGLRRMSNVAIHLLAEVVHEISKPALFLWFSPQSVQLRLVNALPATIVSHLLLLAPFHLRAEDPIFPNLFPNRFEGDGFEFGRRRSSKKTVRNERCSMHSDRFNLSKTNALSPRKSRAPLNVIKSEPINNGG